MRGQPGEVQCYYRHRHHEGRAGSDGRIGVLNRNDAPERAGDLDPVHSGFVTV
uniref:Branchless protein n=1 Tax=Aureimonas altamirensis TaxID=370622 RepID=A0A0P0YXK5_9HYPH|nr:branchless protein [Aureimonas altamirensis]